MRALLVAAALVVAPGSAPAADPAPLAPTPVLDGIKRAVLELARKGRRADMDELLDIDAELHAPAGDLAALRDAAMKALAKAKVAPPPFPDVAKSIAKVAADLGPTLAALEPEPRAAAARQTLRLDGTNADAHRALGHVEKDGAWWPESVVALLPRRAEIQDAVRQARRLEVPIEIEESWMGVLEALYGKKGITAHCGDISIHSASHSKEQLVRQMRQALRGVALANFLINGELKLPATGKTVIVFIATKDVYKRAVAFAKGVGELDDENAKRSLDMDDFTTSGYTCRHSIAETDIGAKLFHLAFWQLEAGDKPLWGTQPALVAGIWNWVYTNFLGIPMPRFAWIEKPEDQKGVTSDLPAEKRRREEMLRLASTGLTGSRMYMKWLARRREDPAWSKAMVDEVGKITGEVLVKATLAVDYLAETEELPRLVRDTRGEKPGTETFEITLGSSLAAFEERWREWLFAGEPASGMAQRLAAPVVEPMTPSERSVVDYVNKLRHLTLGKEPPDVTLDRELSDACRAHALYLGKHRKQLEAWPDAHEEYPDQEGFTPEGCRAGLSSVIDPNAPRGQDAVDGWMATFYHRLPLVEPGLARIGWGHEAGVAVLDAGSLNAPPEDPWFVRWPPPVGKDVPRRFCLELPSPVPGADQLTWGYPVTLQFFGYEAGPELKMRLWVGPSRGGTEIECWYSTPHEPTNIEVAPTGAFCLIPKTPLAANTTYCVAVDGWPKDCHGADWTFTTGR